LQTGFKLYVDIAIALGLVGFLATVAFARFVLARGRTEIGEQTDPKSEEAEPVAMAMSKEES
jgi:multicomponent Na+:H+ antiporter subunit F